jgi:hypothetical protein
MHERRLHAGTATRRRDQLRVRLALRSPTAIDFDSAWQVKAS